MASNTWVININFTTNFLKFVLLSLVLNMLWDTCPYIMRHHLPTNNGNYHEVF